MLKGDLMAHFWDMYDKHEDEVAKDRFGRSQIIVVSQIALEEAIKELVEKSG